MLQFAVIFTSTNCKASVQSATECFWWCVGKNCRTKMIIFLPKRVANEYKYRHPRSNCFKTSPEWPLIAWSSGYFNLHPPQSPQFSISTEGYHLHSNVPFSANSLPFSRYAYTLFISPPPASRIPRPQKVTTTKKYWCLPTSNPGL